MSFKESIMKRFADKNVLVTGGTTGIGRAIAAAFLREGARVLITGRDAKAGNAAIQELRTNGAQIEYLPGDSSNEGDVKRWVDTAVARFGKLDVAVNNAGVEGELGPISAQTDANYNHVFDVNVKGVLLSLKHEINAMQASGGGAIVNTSSMVGQIGMAGASVYVASKHAVNGLTRSAALETAKSGIRVNAVAPGAVRTPMMERFTGGKQDAQAAFAAAHPVGRTGLPDEVAEAVLYLASDKAQFTTGSILTIDGGFTTQ
jgi:NAD(P)-dependent dehydrogenase (short-subunit alcohol dehydrogenase family)